MKKYSSVLLLMLAFSISFGQNADYKKFAVGITVSPDYCFRTLSIDNDYPNELEIATYIKSHRDQHEKARLGYKLGINFSYYLKEHFNLELGLNVAKKGYKNRDVYFADANGNTIGQTVLKYNYNYLEIPLKANFILGKNKARFIAGAGLTPALLVSGVTVYGGKKHQNPQDFIPFNLFASANVGVDFLLGKRIGLKVEPGYQYGLFKTVDAPIKEHLWSAGLNMELCYKF